VEAGTSCLFLDQLPLEIRNRIYKLLLVSDKLTIHVDYGAMPQNGDYEVANQVLPYDRSPQILRTCKAISAEASEVLYEDNVFTVNFFSKHQM